MPYSIGIVGGGIIGMATARELLSRRPGLDVTVLEKEEELARHQTGRNSGVLHTGIYYAPGSLKAGLCTRGRVLLTEYCHERRLPSEECGKLVIALAPAEERRLESIHERARANQVPGVRMIGSSEIAEFEPNARGSRALYSPKAAIVDFVAITRTFAEDVAREGGRILTGARVDAIDNRGDSVSVATTAGTFRFDRLVVCAGLYADGPNAILAFAREGYTLGTLNPRELWLTLEWPGFRAMTRRHWRTGARELRRAIDHRAFVRDARRYVPDLRYRDVVPARSGVRAQAVARSGELLDDFRISKLGSVIAIRNAPSPAATSSMALAQLIAEQVLSD